jgi:hypothetical protein
MDMDRERPELNKIIGYRGLNRRLNQPDMELPVKALVEWFELYI